MAKRSQVIRIAGRAVGEGQPVFIIAEAGVNHNGKLALAKKLVDAAKAAGADAVKFQTFKASEVVTARGTMAAYQRRNTGRAESQLKMLKRVELSAKDFAALAKHAKRRGIIFLSAAHGGMSSVDLLARLKVPAFKFGSADTDNLPVLAHAARLKKPMILSTGMSDLREVAEAVRAVRKAGNNKIVVLQCTTDYPAALADTDLRAMQSMARRLKVIPGYSDHTIGSQAAVMAVTLGATVIEKHLTLNHNLPGPDHKASANPQEFKKFVQGLRDVEVILGSPLKTVKKSARQYLPLVKKSLVARGPIRKGERFTAANVAIKRPSGGLPPKAYFVVLGKRAARNLNADDFIHRKDYV